MFISFGLINVLIFLRTFTLVLRFSGKPGYPLLAGMVAWKDLSSIKTHETPEAKVNLALIRAISSLLGVF